eukprot:g9254.t1
MEDIIGNTRWNRVCLEQFFDERVFAVENACRKKGDAAEQCRKDELQRLRGLMQEQGEIQTAGTSCILEPKIVKTNGRWLGHNKVESTKGLPKTWGALKKEMCHKTLYCVPNPGTKNKDSNRGECSSTAPQESGEDDEMQGCPERGKHSWLPMVPGSVGLDCVHDLLEASILRLEIMHLMLNAPLKPEAQTK